MLDRLAAAASALLLGACSVIGIRSGTEEPRFEVVARLGEVEIRRYAPRLAAETVVAAASEQAARSEGFNRLAGYIFGRNRARAKIAMTAPVAQAPAERLAMTAPVATAPEGAGRWTIRFFMPAGHTRETLPEPEDARVVIAEAPAEVFGVLRFSGLPTEAALRARRAALLAILGQGGWEAAGTPQDWFYDPPWTLPPARRNEVAVPVRPRG